jgi:hypothetical protein
MEFIDPSGNLLELLKFMPGSLRQRHPTHDTYYEQGHASPVELIYCGLGIPVDYSYIAFNILWFPLILYCGWLEPKSPTLCSTSRTECALGPYCL